MVATVWGLDPELQPHSVQLERNAVVSRGAYGLYWPVYPRRASAAEPSEASDSRLRSSEPAAWPPKGVADGYREAFGNDCDAGGLQIPGLVGLAGYQDLHA